MSWDIFVQDIPADVRTIDEWGQKYGDLEPRPIGSRSEIVAKIIEVVPNADFSDPSWGRLEGPDFSIEFSMGDEEPCTGFAMHVRGGNMAAFVVADVLQHLGLRAFDPASDTGLFELGPHGADGLKRWRKYRDQRLNDSNHQA